MADTGLTVHEAARRIGRDPSRIRRLLRAGELVGERRGRDWIISPASVDYLVAHHRSAGRPLTPVHAWAALWFASEEPRLASLAQAWVSDVAAWRLHRTMQQQDWHRNLDRFRRRARVHHLRAHPSDLTRIQDEPDFVATGVSAANAYDFDISAPGVIEGYVPEHRFSELTARYFLAPSDQPNIILHLVDDPWPFPAGQRVAPAIVAAMDLADASDTRTRRAGITYLRSLAAPTS